MKPRNPSVRHAAGLALVTLALCLSGPGPRAAERELNSERIAWAFAGCVASGHRNKAREVLVTMPYSPEERELLMGLRSSSGCLEGGVGSLQMPTSIMRGNIAERLLEIDFEGVLGKPRRRPYAIFEGVPSETFAELGAVQKAAMAMLGFAQCVVRGNPQQVEALFRTEPGSDEEGPAFAQLNGGLSACLDAGEDFRFTRATLRAYLGEAAYRVSTQNAVAGGA